jgi:membrane complex biogenesis BtpA family protein
MYGVTDVESLLEQLFGVEKPVIGMAHFPPLPGTPLYDDVAGLVGIRSRVAQDVEALRSGGVDALLFCNEGDRPYALTAGLEAVAVMTSVITEVASAGLPFGVDFLWDGKAALAMALATGARFIREVVTGVYDSDMGLWNTDPAGLLRYRRYIGAQHIKAFFNVAPEFAAPLGARPVGIVARSAVVSSLADAILVSGRMAGAEPDIQAVREVKAAVGDVPVFVNTGVRPDTVGQFLEAADGVIVGSSLKVGGVTWNPVDGARVRDFMDAVRRVRRGR